MPTLTRSLSWLLLAGVAACQARAPDDLGAAAGSQADLATDSGQAELWRAAAPRSPAGAAVVRPTDTAVAVRRRAEVPSRAIQAQDVAFPAEVRGGLLVTSMPAAPSFRGAARVTQVTGERITIQVGQEQLVLAVRARGEALRVASGEDVQLELRAREEPANRQRIVALSTRDGDGIASILETDARPVSVSLGLFPISARQVGAAEGGTMPVEVQVGRERRTLTQGQVVDFEAGFTVGLRASLALTGADLHRAEGNPYAIELIAWRR